MKNLLMVLLLTPLTAFAQSEQSVADEFVRATIQQFMCVVIYENAGEQPKADIYIQVPIIHAMEHDIPITGEFIQYLDDTLTMIRTEWDELAESTVVNTQKMCDDNYERIKLIVEQNNRPPQAPVIEGTST